MRPIGILALVALAGCAAGLGSNPPITLEERFFETVFFNETTGEVEPYATRWQEPLWYTIEGGTEEDRAAVHRHVAQLGEATGLEVVFDENNPGASIRVLFLDDATYEGYRRSTHEQSLLRNSIDRNPCFVSMRDTVLRPTARVVIRADLSQDMKRRCIAQEISHITGIVNDTDGRSDTVFGDITGADRLTPADVELLRLFYDPRLPQTMTPENTMPIIRQLVASAD